MGMKASNTKITRRQFMARMGTAGAGLVVASHVPGAVQSPARAAVDLRGRGSVVVHHAGGAIAEAYRKAFWEPFEEATGIKVVQVPGTTPAKLLASIKAGSAALDVFPVSAPDMARFIKDGVLEPIDYSLFDPADLAGFKLVKPDKHGVPEIFYASVLAYDRRRFKSNPPKTWGDFWDTGRYAGARALATGATGANSGVWEQALLGDGVVPSRLYPLDFDRVFRSLERIKPALLKFWTSGAEPGQLVVDGQVALTSAYNGRIHDLQSKGVEIDMSWDQGILHYGYWTVPKNAKNTENAMKYIAFISRARRQARFSELIPYAPTNDRAYEFLPAERAAILPTAPSLREKLVLLNYGWWASEGARDKTNAEIAVERWEAWITRTR